MIIILIDFRFKKILEKEFRTKKKYDKNKK